MSYHQLSLGEASSLSRLSGMSYHQLHIGHARQTVHASSLTGLLFISSQRLFVIILSVIIKHEILLNDKLH